MNLLSQWQQDFTQSLFSDLSPSLQKSLAKMSVEAQQQRFNIYKNNVFYSLSNALGDLYPVIKKLVGDNFFAGTAAHYLHKHPPKHAAMVHFGEDFPTFLQEFEHTQNLPYLSDVAKLELFWHKSYHSMDKTPLAQEEFAQINPEELSLAKAELHPSLQMLSSSYAIFSIWQANQDEEIHQEDIHLNEHQQVLVVRPYYEVMLYSIDAGTYTLIEQLGKDHSFAEAIASTIAKHNEFDIGLGISFLIQAQLLTNIIYNNS